MGCSGIIQGVICKYKFEPLPCDDSNVLKVKITIVLAPIRLPWKDNILAECIDISSIT